MQKIPRRRINYKAPHVPKNVKPLSRDILAKLLLTDKESIIAEGRISNTFFGMLQKGVPNQTELSLQVACESDGIYYDKNEELGHIKVLVIAIEE
jgi:hypothetical protein